MGILNCQFVNGKKGTKCLYCDYRLPIDFDEIPKKNCRSEACEHLGQQIERRGVGLTVRCGCTGKDKEQSEPVHQCSKFKRCLPTFRPDIQQRKELEANQSDTLLFKWCCDCEYNPVNQS